MNKADAIMQAAVMFALLGAAALYAVDGILYEIRLILDALGRKDEKNGNTDHSRRKKYEHR